MAKLITFRAMPSIISGLCLALGACLSGPSLSFRIFSENATHIEVCLFQEPQNHEAVKCFELRRDPASSVWATSLSAEEVKALGFEGRPIYYGYRVWGPNWTYDPAWRPGSELGFVADVDRNGHRFNPNKLALDPYALEVSHGMEQVPDMTIFETGPLHRLRDSALAAPKGVVVPNDLRPLNQPKPKRAFKDDVIYEVHVKGFTKSDASIPSHLRGTFKGAALKAKYLKDLGVTAVEFLPVHTKVSEHNNPNYWGYMTLNYFSPERSYAFDQSPGGPIAEFRAMVEEFHRHGIKVFIDVVYNHTGEGGANAAMPAHSSIYSFRGIDNSVYYELNAKKDMYEDNTGCGHNFATFREPVRQFIMDSLAYWKDRMGVDGFRFDLAPVIGNVPENGKFVFKPEDPRGVLKRAVNELPARPAEGGDGVDLIAESWGVGEGTFVQGRFPKGWAEWNAEGFRDHVRSFFNKRGYEPVTIGQLANAISGSASVFARNGRKPWSAVNILTSHDGFTARDLFSYNDKNNSQPWPYGPSDGGENHNRSWDQGGDEALQRQLTRTALMTLLLSAGTPHLNGGDELYRTLRGNNNPWNLDSVANYLQWETLPENSKLKDFVAFLLKFRRENPALRPAEYYEGRDRNGNGLKDVTWYTSDGRELRAKELQYTGGFLAYRLDATEFSDASPVRSIFIATNAEFYNVNVRLPTPAPGHAWFRLADTAAWFEADGNFHPPGQEARVERDYEMHSRCELLLIEKPLSRP